MTRQITLAMHLLQPCSTMFLLALFLGCLRFVDSSSNCPLECVDADCIDTGSVFECQCKSGFMRVTSMACVDINECALGTFDCDPNSDCVNQPGTYTCVCHEGYVKSGGKCIDIDECALGTDQCDLHSTCVNTEGSYMCPCNTGYLGDGLITGIGCQDYCEGIPCQFGGTCSVTRETYVCDCLPYYEGPNCENNATVCDALSPCTPDATCINGRVVEPNEFPDFTCNCSAGLGHSSCTVLRPEASQSIFEGRERTYVIAGVAIGVVLLLLVILLVSRKRRHHSRDEKSSNSSSKHKKADSNSENRQSTNHDELLESLREQNSATVLAGFPESDPQTLLELPEEEDKEDAGQTNHDNTDTEQALAETVFARTEENASCMSPDKQPLNTEGTDYGTPLPIPAHDVSDKDFDGRASSGSHGYYYTTTNTVPEGVIPESSFYELPENDEADLQAFQFPSFE